MTLARTTSGAARELDREIRSELEQWRERAVPSTSAPLDAEDLVRLLRDLVSAVRLDAEIARGFSTNTVHYYRRKDIIDPPDGRTAAARYNINHLWQIAGARLAGHLGLVTLAEARNAIRGASSTALVTFVAARVADARAKSLMLSGADTNAVASAARPLPGRGDAGSESSTVSSTVISLPDDALCILPLDHPARRSADAAHDLVRALSGALRAMHSR